jgi:hypothetical protein
MTGIDFLLKLNDKIEDQLEKSGNIKIGVFNSDSQNFIDGLAQMGAASFLSRSFNEAKRYSGQLEKAPNHLPLIYFIGIHF